MRGNCPNECCDGCYHQELTLEVPPYALTGHCAVGSCVISRRHRFSEHKTSELLCRSWVRPKRRDQQASC